MTQEDTIRAYLLHQLSPTETAAFKQKILADPKLTVKVKGMKLMLLMEKAAEQDRLREKMKEWDKEAPFPGPVPWWRSYQTLLLAGIGLLLAGIIWVLWPVDPPPPPPPPPPSATIFDKAPDTSIPIYPPAPPATSATARLALWAASIVSIEITQQEQDVAMRSQRVGGEIRSKPQRLTRDSFFTGVITQIAGKKYVLAASEAVSLAASSPSVIVAHDFNRNKFDLRLIGKDDLFGVAVLELVEAATPTPPGLVLAPTNTVEKNSPVFMFGNPLNKKQIGQKAVNGKLNQQQNGCILVQTPAAWPSADGPVVNDKGQITGLVSPFARAAFPRQKNDRTERCALTADFISEIVQRIIEEHTIMKPYLGIDFEQIAGVNEVKVYKVLPGSPASPYAGELLNQRIDSINSKSVKNLIEVSTVLSRIPPKSVVLLTHSTANGPKKIQKIYSKVLDNKAMEAIADAMVEDMPGFSMVSSPGSPQVEYKGGAFENGIYYVQAACGGSGPCPDNIRTKADLGAHLQGMALLNDGRLRLYNEIKNIEREHNISFNTNRLCH